MSLFHRVLTGIILSTLSFQAFSSEASNARFKTLIKNYKVTPHSEQSYCYTDEKGNFKGINIDKKVRLASVSKVLTSLWAVKEFGAHHTYNTVFYIKGKHMHIQGAYDPFMSNEKMIYIVSSLNKLGITSLDKITYDRLIQINPSAQFYTGTHPIITRETNKQRLQLYFNTARWTATLKADYRKYSNLAKAGRYVKNPTFSVKTVEFSESNPFYNPKLEEAPSEVRVLTLKSPMLYKYLKEINVKSNNYASHTIFQDLGGEKKFNEFIKNNYGFNSSEIAMFTGSGLPSSKNGKRIDNYGTCRIVAKLTEELKVELEKQRREIEDVIAVPGNDAGTFRNRLNTNEYRNTLVAKTGTLRHTSTLAGAINTQKGFSFFGIYNHTGNVQGAKSVQNLMVKRLFTEMGGPKNFNYKVEGFLPYNPNLPLKSQLLELEDTGFTEIEDELIESI